MRFEGLMLGLWLGCAMTVWSHPDAFKEKPVEGYVSKYGEAYSISVVPFGENPVLVRICYDHGQATIGWKQLSGEGLYYDGRLISDEQKPLSLERWKYFQSLLVKAGFWSKKDGVKSPPVLDGELFWFEGYREGRKLKFYRTCVGLLPEDKELAKATVLLFGQVHEIGVLRQDPYYSQPIEGMLGDPFILDSRKPIGSKLR